MNRDEQRQIIALIDRALRHGASSAGAVDIEADVIIRALFVRHPEAAYRVTKLAIAQSEEIERLRAVVADAARVRRFGWLTRFFKPVQMGTTDLAE
jgi:hypothetical protein